MKAKSLVLASAALCLCAAALTACGSTKINLNDYLTVTYDGYETVGKASAVFDVETMISENPEAFGLKGTPSELEIAAVEMLIEEEIDGSLSAYAGLSNGDTINWVWRIGSVESLQEKYPVRFAYEDASYTVDGLQEAEAFDPFEGITVSFGGIAPNGSVQIDDGGKALPALRFTAEPGSNLRNGDTVTVTVSASGDLDDYCGQNGKVATATEKTYTVEVLSAYAMKLDEIPDDMMAKLEQQAEDSLRADAAGWDEGNSIKELKKLGCYFVAAKAGFSPRPTNQIYLIYQVTASMTGITADDHNNVTTGEDTYYTYVSFSDLLLLDDGTCSVDLSNNEKPGNQVESTYGFNGFFGASPYKFYGYSDLDTMFNDCVTTKIGEYDYENTVKE